MCQVVLGEFSRNFLGAEAGVSVKNNGSPGYLSGRKAGRGKLFLENTPIVFAAEGGFYLLFSVFVVYYGFLWLLNYNTIGGFLVFFLLEADKRLSLEAVCEQMGRTPPWAEGLLLRADGYTTEFYRKD